MIELTHITAITLDAGALRDAKPCRRVHDTLQAYPCEPRNWEGSVISRMFSLRRCKSYFGRLLRAVVGSHAQSAHGRVGPSTGAVFASSTSARRHETMVNGQRRLWCLASQSPSWALQPARHRTSTSTQTGGTDSHGRRCRGGCPCYQTRIAL